MSIAHLAVYAQTPNEVESKDLYLKTLIQELEQESGVNIYYESAILDDQWKFLRKFLRTQNYLSKKLMKMLT